MPNVPRLFPGRTIVCVASGPSLTREDVGLVRGMPVIAVNDAVRLCDWADVLYSSDAHWWKFFDGMPSFTGLKYALEPMDPTELSWFRKWLDIKLLRNTGSTGLERSPDGLKHGSNSGAAAINLAVHLGASRIVLLGYDMAVWDQRHTHFFGRHPQALTRASPFPIFRERIAAMVGPLQDAGVAVVNCSRQTALECFQRMDLEDVVTMQEAVA